jgi:hypothetical protein
VISHECGGSGDLSQALILLVNFGYQMRRAWHRRVDPRAGAPLASYAGKAYQPRLLAVSRERLRGPRRERFRGNFSISMRSLFSSAKHSLN